MSFERSSPGEPRCLRFATPTTATVAELLDWRPPSGVLSAYVDFDPADRGGRWQIELRDGLSRAVTGAKGGDREARLALEATAGRLGEALLGEPGEAHGRSLIGFLEVSREPAQERWFAVRVALTCTEVCYGPSPQVGPLVAVLDDGAPLGVAAVSAERVRLFDWRLGTIDQLHDWELELFSLDWRERKSPRSRNTAAGPMVTAAGRDQYDQRLESNRERFAHQSGALARASARRLGWRQLLVFGDERYTRQFVDGFAGACEVRRVDSSDLVTQPTHRIAERVDALLDTINRDREQALIERIHEAAYAEARSALGRQETLQALEQGRVEHLVYDAGQNGIELERMIALAASTGAAITPVEGESAARLTEQGGVAALLRY